MKPHVFSADVDTSILVEGLNTLSIQSLSTGAPVSYVYLDRFSLEYPHTLSAEGALSRDRPSPTASSRPRASPPDPSSSMSPGRAPRWLGRSGSALVFPAQQDHRYLAVSPEAFLRPRSAPSRCPPCATPRTRPTGSSSPPGTSSPPLSLSSTCATTRASPRWPSPSRRSTTSSASERSHPRPSTTSSPTPTTTGPPPRPATSSSSARPPLIPRSTSPAGPERTSSPPPSSAPPTSGPPPTPRSPPSTATTSSPTSPSGGSPPTRSTRPRSRSRGSSTSSTPA